MGLEDKVQAAGEQLVQRVRQQAEQEIRGFVSELLTEAARERAQALDENRRVAEEGKAQAVREATARVRAEVEKTWAAKLREAHETAEVRYADAQREARAEANRQLTQKVASVRAEGQRVLEAALEAARQEADRHLAERIDQVRAEAERMLVRELAAASREGGAGSGAGDAGDGDPGVLSRALEGVRRLDGASSLTDVLDVLAELIGVEAPRAAVLTVEEERLRGWRFVGFEPPLGKPRAVRMSLGEAGVVGRAVVAGEMRTAEAGAGAAPSFTVLEPGVTATAVPVWVGGQVMAVVYGDDTGAPATPVWRHTLEILARHAGHCLEALTAARSAQLAMRDFHAAVVEDPGPRLPFEDAETGDTDHLGR